MSNGQPTDVIETMGNRGCGPTAMAMVASKLKGGNGNPYSPENMARIAENGNYTYTSNINKRIVSRICNIFFEIYK